MMTSKLFERAEMLRQRATIAEDLISTAGKRSVRRALRFQQSAQRHRLQFRSRDENADSVQRRHC